MTPRSILVVLSVEALAFAFLAGAQVDRRLHQRDPIYGVNQWGYRDTARGFKGPGEIRVALVGGSSAFEAGTIYSGTVSGKLFLELRAAGAPRKQEYSVVNLAEPRAGAADYVAILRDYSYLRPDVVCIYDGYDELSGSPPHGRRRSVVFRTVGYLPLLPARLLGLPAWLSDADGGLATILEDAPGGADPSCAGASRSYCEAMSETVRYGLERGYAMMVVSPPSVSSRHSTQQQSVAGFLTPRFGGDSRFRHLDLGSVMDMTDAEHSPDGLHRTDLGNHIVAQRIATAILQWPAVGERQRR